MKLYLEEGIQVGSRLYQNIICCILLSCSIKISNLRSYLDMATEDVDTTLVVPSQLSSSRRCPQDQEVEESKRHRRIPSSRSFVIVFEVEPTHKSTGEVIFASRYHNEDTEVHA